MPSTASTSTATTCESCIFFEDHAAKAAQDAGLCRFNPPLSQSEPEAVGVWPVVKSDDWCGQFTAERH